MLLKSLCVVLVERGRDGKRLRTGAKTGGEDPILKDIQYDA